MLVVNLYLSSKWHNITFIEIIAYLLPIQFRGPALNGTKANGCRWATVSGRKRSGSKSLAVGPQIFTFLCIFSTHKTNIVPSGTVQSVSWISSSVSRNQKWVSGNNRIDSFSTRSIYSNFVSVSYPMWSSFVIFFRISSYKRSCTFGWIANRSNVFNMVTELVSVPWNETWVNTLQDFSSRP